jgi:hypothetical protein
MSTPGNRTRKPTDSSSFLPELGGLLGLAVSLVVLYTRYAPDDRTWLLTLGLAVAGAVPGVLIGMIVDRILKSRAGSKKL